MFSPPCYQCPYTRWGWLKVLSVWNLHVPSGIGTLTKTCSDPGLYTASPWPAGVPDGGERNWLEWRIPSMHYRTTASGKEAACLLLVNWRKHGLLFVEFGPQWEEVMAFLCIVHVGSVCWHPEVGCVDSVDNHIQQFLSLSLIWLTLTPKCWMDGQTDTETSPGTRSIMLTLAISNMFFHINRRLGEERLSLSQQRFEVCKLTTWILIVPSNPGP